MRQPGNELGLFPHVAHVIDRTAHVLGSDVAAAKRVDGAAERGEQFGGFRGVIIGQDDRFAAAKFQAGNGVLVGHATRQPQCVGQRIAVVGVSPATTAACRRAERGRVHRYDRAQPGRFIVEVMQRFVIIEFGVIEDAHFFPLQRPALSS